MAEPTGSSGRVVVVGSLNEDSVLVMGELLRRWPVPHAFWSAGWAPG
ncbi:MAG: hypothetical protein ABSE77_02365 [Acidimicrobiales bacterium]